MTDQALLDKWLKERDAEAFKEITARYLPLVYGTALRILGNAVEAEDVAQACFEKLTQTTQAPATYLGAWLHRVATNLSLNLVKAEKRRKQREEKYARERMNSSQSIRSEPGWDEICGYVDEAIADLPDKLRIPLIAHFIENKPHHAIATMLGVSRQTVTYRIKKGLVRVRKSLQKRGIPVAGSAALAATLGAHMTEAHAVPAVLQVTLAKVAMAGVKGSGVAAGTGAKVASLGGVLAMKHLAIGLAVLGAVAVGTRSLVRNDANEVKVQSGSMAQVAEDNTNSVNPDLEPPETNMARADVTSQEEARVPDSALDDVRGSPVADGGAIIARVYDPDSGEPLPGIEIAVISRVKEGNGTRNTYFSITSDSTGSFRLDDLKPGTYEFKGPRQRGVPDGVAQKSVELGEGETAFCELPVPAGTTIRGHVFDEQGSPLGGASIRALTSQENTWRTSESTEDGAFLIACFEGPGTDFRVLATKAGYAMLPLRNVTVPEGGLSGLVLTMFPEATLSGTVKDSRGNLVEDVGVCAAADRRWDEEHTTRTSAEGAFVLKGLRDARYSIVISQPGSRSWSFENEVTQVDVGPGEHIEGLSLVWDPPGQLAISGRVTYTHGKPIGLAPVMLQGPVSRSLQTERDGTYRFADLPEGLYRVSAEDGFPPDTGRSYTKENIPAGTENVDFVFEKPAVLKGKVVDSRTKEPVDEFELTWVSGIKQEIDGHIMWQYRPVNHPQGEFTIGGVPPGEATLFVRAPGHAPKITFVDQIIPGERVDDIVVELEQGTVIEGLVRNAQGEPLSGARIYTGPVPEHQHRTRTAVATTDDTGQFRINVVEARSQILSADHTEYAPNSVEVPTPTSHVRDAEIVLTPGGTIEGWLTVDGVPAPNKHVYLLYGGDVGIETTTTDEDGKFSLENIMPGELLSIKAYVSPITGVHRGSLSIVRDTIVREGEVVEVDLACVTGGCAIEGMVTAGGEPSNRPLVIEASSKTGETMQFNVTPAHDGYYSVEGIPAGDVVVKDRLWNPEMECWDLVRSITINLPPDTTLQQDLDLTPQ
jgi:RNA polymerase sigma factor (sigma-70 family)